MRQDMKTVLTERPRHGLVRKFHEVRTRTKRGNYDDLPAFEGMRRPYLYGFNNKQFSDHIKPLIRFLWSSVGRKWDDVWSEIAAQVPAGSTMNDHLRGHVFSEIDLHCTVENGKVFPQPNRYRWRSNVEPTGLYVDPRDGVIKAGSNDYHNSRSNHRRRFWNDREVPAPTSCEIDGGVLRLIDGIWYQFDCLPLPLPKVITVVVDGERKTKLQHVLRRDEFLGTTIHHGQRVTDNDQWLQRGVYHANKRQLSSADLKRHGLRNA